MSYLAFKTRKGEAFIDGINVTAHADSARKKIGYISENVNLYPYLTGIENLNYFCKIAGKFIMMKPYQKY